MTCPVIYTTGRGLSLTLPGRRYTSLRTYLHHMFKPLTVMVCLKLSQESDGKWYKVSFSEIQQPYCDCLSWKRNHFPWLCLSVMEHNGGRVQLSSAIFILFLALLFLKSPPNFENDICGVDINLLIYQNNFGNSFGSSFESLWLLRMNNKSKTS